MRPPNPLIRAFLGAAIMACCSEAALAQGAGDFLDYCKSIEGKYASTSAAIEAEVDATQKRLEGWNRDPSTLPDGALAEYRTAVRAASFKQWEQTATAQLLIKTLTTANKDVDVPHYFFENIYRKELSEAQERDLALRVFKFDYEQRIKPKVDADIKTVRANLSESKAKLDENCKDDVLSQVFRGTIGRLLLTIEGNRQAAKDEKGDLAAFVRLTSGISITDIMTHGLRGGPNSELAKLGKTWTDGLDAVGIGKNSFLRQAAAAVDVTNMQVPKQLQITVDGGSLRNLEKNLNPTKWRW